MIWATMAWKTGLAVALVSGFLLLGGATTARAADFYGCRRNLDKWEDRLERDTDRHGYYSRKANHDRHELAEAREHCERRYGNYRDYDHDGDRR